MRVFAIRGAVLSLVALQTLYVCLSQFAAVTATLVQVAILLVLVAYRDRYGIKSPLGRS